MEIKEAIMRIEDHKRIHYAKESRARKITEALDMAVSALNNQKNIKESLKYYLDINEENGVVYIPKFIIEKIVYES